MRLSRFLSVLRESTLETITSSYGKEVQFLIDPTTQALIGFMRRHAKGQARIVVTASNVYVWSAFDLTHTDGKYALELSGWWDEGQAWADGVLSTGPDFTADPGMWSLPRRLGPLWYEFDAGARLGFTTNNQVWQALRAGLERLGPAPLTEAEDRPYIDAHRSENVIWIDMIHVPRGQRGQGVGAAYYREWESNLPKDIDLIRLVSADTGSGTGNASWFWEAMGFSFNYDIEDRNNAAYWYMWKGVNGHPTPPTIPEDLDESYKFLQMDATADQPKHATVGYDSLERFLRSGRLPTALAESFGGFSRGAFWVDPDGQLHEVEEDDDDYDHARYVDPDYDAGLDPNDDFDAIQERRARVKWEFIAAGWVRMEFDRMGRLEIEANSYALARRAAALVLSDSAKGIDFDLTRPAPANHYGVSTTSYQIEPGEFRRFLKGGWTPSKGLNETVRRVKIPPEDGDDEVVNLTVLVNPSPGEVSSMLKKCQWKQLRAAAQGSTLYLWQAELMNHAETLPGLGLTPINAHTCQIWFGDAGKAVLHHFGANAPRAIRFGQYAVDRAWFGQSPEIARALQGWNIVLDDNRDHIT